MTDQLSVSSFSHALETDRFEEFTTAVATIHAALP
jgi:hypothetical protein